VGGFGFLLADKTLSYLSGSNTPNHNPLSRDVHKGLSAQNTVLWVVGKALEPNRGD